MIFKSKSKNLTLPFKPRILKEVGGQVIVKQEASYIEFKNGQYETTDQEEIKFLTNHTSYKKRFTGITEKEIEDLKRESQLKAEFDKIIKETDPKDLGRVLRELGMKTPAKKKTTAKLKSKDDKKADGASKNPIPDNND